jgi:glycosyltransferase 2 family protein
LSASLAKSILKYALGLALLAYVIVRNWAPAGAGPGLAEAFRRPVRLLAVLLAALFLAATALITFVRWYLLVRAQKVPITLGGAVRLGLVGDFFNSLLLSSVGGDLVKAVAVARTQRRRTAANATILLDRAIGLWGLVWLVALLGGGFWLADDPGGTSDTSRRFRSRTA